MKCFLQARIFTTKSALKINWFIRKLSSTRKLDCIISEHVMYTGLSMLFTGFSVEPQAKDLAPPHDNEINLSLG